MRVADFSYPLPKALVAQYPFPTRDHSRLMVWNRSGNRIEHRVFYELVDYLRPGDLLVLNDTRVIPARLFGRKRASGGKVEILLLRRLSDRRWQVLLKAGSGNVPLGTEIELGGGLLGWVCEQRPEGAIVEFLGPISPRDACKRYGSVPLPPYIKRNGVTQTTSILDRERYQTVYARCDGSVAAPTAGLHFTERLLDQVRQKGVEVLAITLHVGVGSFRPIRHIEVQDHFMESEWFHIGEMSAARFNAAKADHRRVIAVGTTTVRALESAADPDGRLKPMAGETELFIYPSYRFRVVDAILTNFHLPRSTLLMLVCAFAGREDTLQAYRLAIAEGYRFYSYGDAMFIFRER